MHTLDQKLNPNRRVYVLKHNQLWSISSLHRDTLLSFNLMKNYENKLMSLANDFNTTSLVLKITTHFILIYDHRNGHKIYVAS